MADAGSVKTNNTSMKRIIIIGSIVLIAFFGMTYGCSKRNSFVDLNEEVQSQLHQVESQYQRRADLIPSIVKTVEAEANFEKSTPYSCYRSPGKSNPDNH